MSNIFYVIHVKLEQIGDDQRMQFVHKVKQCYSLDDVKHYVKMKGLDLHEYTIIEGGEIRKP